MVLIYEYQLHTQADLFFPQNIEPSHLLTIIVGLELLLTLHCRDAADPNVTDVFSGYGGITIAVGKCGSTK